MKTIQITTALVVVVLLGATGCKKYDEGPALSLRTKKARLTNEWRIEYAFDFGDGVVTSDYTGETWELGKGGEYLEKDFGLVDKSGTWEFISDKEVLRITKFDNGKVDHYTILKLKSKELWLMDDSEELHLVPVN